MHSTFYCQPSKYPCTNTSPFKSFTGIRSLRNEHITLSLIAEISDANRPLFQFGPEVHDHLDLWLKEHRLLPRAVAVPDLQITKAISAPRAAPHWVGWGGAGIWEETDRTADSNWPKWYSTLYDIVVNNKNLGKEGEVAAIRTLLAMVFVFPSNHYTWWSSAVQEEPGHLPADRKQRINSLFCFVWVHRTFHLLNCLYLRPQVFLVLLFWFSSPSCCRERGERGKKMGRQLGGCWGQASKTVIYHQWPWALWKHLSFNSYWLWYSWVSSDNRGWNAG